MSVTVTQTRATARVLAPGAVVLVLAALFVGLRLLTVAHGGLGDFVLRGSLLSHVQGSPVPAPAIRPGAGYDGQFYYRMALDPGDLATTGHGVTLDEELRRGRIGYPFLAFLLAVGRPAAVPAALVAVNVLALAAVAVLGGVLARDAGRSPLWGLLPALYGGLVTSLARDLTEPTAVALLLAGLVAWQRGRPAVAALAMTGAALCRETAVLLPVALLLVAAVDLLRRRARPGWAAAWLVVPLAGFAAWQTWCAARYGGVPVLSDRRNAEVPGAAVLQAVQRWAGAPSKTHLELLGQLAVLVLVVVLAVVAARNARGSRAPAVALLLAVGLVLSLSTDVWNDDLAEYRTFVDVHLYASVLLLGAGRLSLLRLAALGTGGVALMTVALRLVAL